MEVLAGIILALLLKATSREKMTWPDSHEFVAVRKLHCLTGSTHSGVSILIEKPRDGEAARAED